MDTFSQDLKLQLVTDAPPPAGGIETRHKLRVLADAPQSLLVATPAGRLIIYDGDQPRPFTSDDFPSFVTVMDPVLASSTYVYALQVPDPYNKVPCVVRFSVDGFGFGPAEDFCNIGANWGAYPEMKVYAGTLVLEDSSGAYGINQQPDVGGNMRIAAYYDASLDLVSTLYSLIFQFMNTSSSAYRIAFSQMSTGQPIGHFPPEGWIDMAGEYPSSIMFADNETMLYFNRFSAQTAIVPNWQTAIQRYP